MNNPIPSATMVAGPDASTQRLHCNVTVEASSIDFLGEGALLVAGTNDCGCGILPMPTAQTGRRRGPASSKR